MPTIEKELGAIHISSDLQNYETARSNFFAVVVSGLTNLREPYKDAGQSEFIRGAAQATSTMNPATNIYEDSGDIIRLSVNKMFVPHFKLGVIDVKRGNSIVKFASTPEWNSGSIELQDFVGLETKNALMAWQALAYDIRTDTQGRAAEWIDMEGNLRQGYKKNCTLIEYTPDRQQIRSWELIGCWISDIQEQPFEVTNGGERTITCTLEYDRAYPKKPQSR